MKIFVAGHRGLVGSALVRKLMKAGYSDLVTRSHEELDLIRRIDVRTFFEAERPEVVFLAAAKVGGIIANSQFPAEFIRHNLAIQTNVIHEAWRAGVKRLVFLGSSCIYPRVCPQPIREEYLLTGPLEPTNSAYAMAKLAGIEMCNAYNRQYGTRYVSIMPSNLYGPGDNFDPENGHVLPALIQKFYIAKLHNAPMVTLWGTGTPRREFLYVDDMASACIHIGMHTDTTDMINIGAGTDITIRELAELIAGIVGYRGRILLDPSMPDGTPQKLLDVSKAAALGWTAATQLEDGIKATYDHFLTGIGIAGLVPTVTADRVNNLLLQPMTE